jgi:hypothetical protein
MPRPRTAHKRAGEASLAPTFTEHPTPSVNAVAVQPEGLARTSPRATPWVNAANVAPLLFVVFVQALKGRNGVPFDARCVWTSPSRPFRANGLPGGMASPLPWALLLRFSPSGWTD